MIVYTFTGTAADRDGICASQTPLAAGNLTINGILATGGVATLSNQQRVSIYSGSDISGRTFVVYGTQDNGQSITESIAGPGATTVYTTKNFKTVTRISVDAATGAALEVGVKDAGETCWLSLDQSKPLKCITFELSTGASLTYELQWANYLQSTAPLVGSTMIPITDESSVFAFADSTITSKTVSAMLVTTNNSMVARLEITSYVSGTLTMIINESEC